MSARGIPKLGGDILAEMCEVRGIRLATGLSLKKNRRSYRDLLEWLGRQAWYHAAEPIEALDRRLWRIRAALLDAFAYQP
jgi:hypothetical protein